MASETIKITWQIFTKNIDFLRKIVQKKHKVWGKLENWLSRSYWTMKNYLAFLRQNRETSNNFEYILIHQKNHKKGQNATRNTFSLDFNENWVCNPHSYVHNFLKIYDTRNRYSKNFQILKKMTNVYATRVTKSHKFWFDIKVCERQHAIHGHQIIYKKVSGYSLKTQISFFKFEFEFIITNFTLKLFRKFNFY